MKRQIPLALCFLFGIAMILTEFSPHPISQTIYNEVVNWTLIIWPFATVLAVATLVQTHCDPDSTARTEHWQYSFLVFAGMIHHGCDRHVPFGPQTLHAFEWLYQQSYRCQWTRRCFRCLRSSSPLQPFAPSVPERLRQRCSLITAVIVMLGNVPDWKPTFGMQVMSWTTLVRRCFKRAPVDFG